MSIFDAKMPSLKDKIREKAQESKEVEVVEEVESKEEVKKGRRLNK